MKACCILSFTLFTFNNVWGKLGGGGAPASWLMGLPIVDLAPTGCISCSVANLAIQTLTCTLCALHQSIWFFARPLTPTRRVECMCVVLRVVSNGSWTILTWNALVIVSWGAVSSDGWTKGKEHVSSWGWFLNSHFFTNLTQHFFYVTNITNWASHAFPKMWSLMTVLTRL
jgi:hypothetical protein